MAPDTLTPQHCRCRWPAQLGVPLAPEHAAPSAHPEAAWCLEVIDVCLGPLTGSLQVATASPLEVIGWHHLTAGTQPGVLVRWQGKVVLLGTRGPNVWLYRPSADWEAALRQLAHAGETTTQDVAALPPGVPQALRSPPAVASETLDVPPGVPGASTTGAPGWTGGERPGSLPAQEHTSVRLALCRHCGKDRAHHDGPQAHCRTSEPLFPSSHCYEETPRGEPHPHQAVLEASTAAFRRRLA